MLMRRPKSSRLLSKGNSKDDAEVVQSSTTSLPKSKKSFKNIFHILIFVPLNVEGVGRGRSLSSQREKLPTLAQVNREISDKSAELLGRRAMDVGQLVDWIADKRGQSAFTNRASPTSRVQASCAAFTWNMTRRSPLPAGTLTGNHPRGVSADCDQHILHNCWTLNDLMTPEHLGSRERGGSEIFLVNCVISHQFDWSLVQVPGNRQRSHEVQADFLHAQSGRPDSVCPGQHDLHRPQQVRQVQPSTCHNAQWDTFSWSCGNNSENSF